MRNFISGFVGLVLALTTLVAVNSCTVEEYNEYPSLLEGTWIADYTYLGPIHPDDAERFSFYSDGCGVMRFIGEFGQPVSIGFTWNVFRDNRLEIYYEDGVVDLFHFRFYRDYLELSTSPHFRTYTGYARY